MPPEPGLDPSPSPRPQASATEAPAAPAAPGRLARWAPNAAVALALLPLAFRFWQIGLSPFILDEPIFLSAAREQLLPGGHWASFSPLIGTQGFHYGPSVVWFYGVVEWAFGPEPRTAILINCALAAAAQLMFALAVSQGRRVVFAPVLALIASSPYLFFWSRLAWDSLSFSLPCIAMALVAGRVHWTPARALALGLVLGLGISAHPMLAPVALLIGVTLVVDLRRTPRRVLGYGALYAGAMVLVNVPYILYVWRQPHGPPTAVFEGSPLLAFVSFLRTPAQVLTTADISYFFDDEWPVFLSWLGAWRGLIEPRPVVWIVAAAMAALGLLIGLVRGGGTTRRVALLAAVAWIGYAAFYAERAVKLHPHYAWPYWWVIPAGVACGLTWAWQRSARFGAILAAGVGAFAALQFAFVFAWMAYVRTHDGVRGIHYSTPVARLEEAVRSACSVPDRTLALLNGTRVMGPALDYLIRMEPACAGKQVLVCPSTACRPPPGARVLTLVYAEPTGAAVTWLGAGAPAR